MMQLCSWLSCVQENTAFLYFIISCVMDRCLSF